MQKKVTIYDVAERLGISTATVNRAMNEKGSISDKTKRLVQETAREMGYHPSKSASSLKRNPRRIAVLLPNTIHGYQAEVERGVHKATEELAEYSVECEVFKENDEDMEVFIRRLHEISDMNFDGIIILPPFDEAQMSRAVQDLREQKKQYYVTVTSDLQDSAEPERRSRHDRLGNHQTGHDQHHQRKRRRGPRHRHGRAGQPYPEAAS